MKKGPGRKHPGPFASVRDAGRRAPAAPPERAFVDRPRRGAGNEWWQGCSVFLRNLR